jgi:hypothetical protein
MIPLFIEMIDISNGLYGESRYLINIEIDEVEE